MNENRKSTWADSTNKANQLETSTNTFDVYITKNKPEGKSVEIRYYNLQLVVKTNSEELVYKTKTRGSLTNETTTAAFSSSRTYRHDEFTNVTSKKIANITESITNIDQTPSEIYVNLYYYAKVTNQDTKEVTYEEKNILYKTTVTEAAKVINEELAKKNVISHSEYGAEVVFEEQSSTKLYIDLDASSANYSNDNNYNVDEFDIYLLFNATDKVIKNIKYELVGKVVNEENDKDDRFKDAVYLGCYYGYLPATSTLPLIATSLDVNYKISMVYVKGVIEYTDGSTVNQNFKVSIDDLKKLD